jgi:hypothetical protein
MHFRANYVSTSIIGDGDYYQTAFEPPGPAVFFASRPLLAGDDDLPLCKPIKSAILAPKPPEPGGMSDYTNFPGRKMMATVEWRVRGDEFGSCNCNHVRRGHRGDGHDLVGARGDVSEQGRSSVRADVEARRARLNIPGLLEATGEPIRNPVTGAEHRARRRSSSEPMSSRIANADIVGFPSPDHNICYARNPFAATLLASHHQLRSVLLVLV